MDFTQKKCLTAYFSHRGGNYTANGICQLEKGNTEVAAEMIRDLTGSDLYEIEPAEPYPDDYRQCVEAAKKELRANARPKLKSRQLDMAQYDVIFLGYPNWCGTMPMAVCTFLETYDLKGKTILPFCTNEGSAMGSSERDLMKLVPEADVRKGIPIRGSDVDEAKPKLRLWLEAAAQQ